MISRRGRGLSAGVAPLLMLLAAFNTGCGSRPRAPALRDSSVYQNRAAGLRFLVPQGWTQVANSAIPSGKLTAELMLVKYQMKTSARGAVLEVLCFDDPQAIDLCQYHAQPSHGVGGWKPEGVPAGVTIGGATGERFQYQGTVGKSTMHKDVTVFRRGQRVFSFVGLYWDDDRNAREEIRRAIDSVVW